MTIISVEELRAKAASNIARAHRTAKKLLKPHVGAEAEIAFKHSVAFNREGAVRLHRCTIVGVNSESVEFAPGLSDPVSAQYLRNITRSEERRVGKECRL